MRPFNARVLRGARPTFAHQLSPESKSRCNSNSASSNGSQSAIQIYKSERKENEADLENDLTKPKPVDPGNPEQIATVQKKRSAEMDEDIKAKMAGLEGDGGIAGAELEDGKPVAIKRGVKNNMFRIFEFIPRAESSKKS